ncbi:MAG: protease modulator HflK, partial [Succinivibrio sp.]|nr:protease modulator HflK [Succinivibrio sp.]
AYANEVLPKAEGQVQRIKQESEAYRSQVVLKAEGEVARFEKVLPEYNAAPDITKTRIYLETMQEVLGKSQKIFLDVPKGSSPVLYLPMPQSNANTESVKTENTQSQSSTPASTSQSSNTQQVPLRTEDQYPPLSESTQNSYGTSSRRVR